MVGNSIEPGVCVSPLCKRPNTARVIVHFAGSFPERLLQDGVVAAHTGCCSNRQAPIVLCILGQDPFASSIASTIPQKTNKDRPALVRHVQSDKEFSGCHILYIGSSERKSAAHIFSSLSGSSTLTVGETAQFAAQGGMIQFSVEDQRVRFDINVNATSRAGLKISSKLLALSQIVKN